MAESQEDVRKFMCEWITVDKKKLSASTHADAALIILGADMRAKAFKTIIKGNTPSAKEKEIFVFSWEHITKISISRKKPIHELTFTLNKEKSKHGSCVIAANPQVFEKLYEVLNVVLSHIMNQKSKNTFMKKNNNVKILGAFDMQRGEMPQNPGTSQQKSNSKNRTIDDLINSMLQTLDQKDLGDNVRVVLAELPKDGTLLDTEDFESEDDGDSEENKDEPTEVNKKVATEENEVVASEETKDVVTEENKNVEPAENTNEDIISKNKMNFESENNLSAEPQLGLELDLYQFLNLPFAVVVIFTLFIKFIFYLIFNQEI